MTAELRDYYRELDRHLNCPRKLRRDFHRETRRMADDLLQSSPGATAGDISAFLGEPAALAAAFQETIDPAVLARYRKRRRAGRWIAGAGLALVLCVTAALGWAKWSQAQEVIKGDVWVVQGAPEEITQEEFEAIHAEIQKQASTLIP